MKKIISLAVVLSFLVIAFPLTNAAECNTKINENNTQTLEEQIQIRFSVESKSNFEQLKIKGVLSNSLEKKYEDFSVLTKKFQIDKNKCEIYKADNNYFYLNLEETVSSGSPGEPLLPMKTYSFEIPKNSEVAYIGIKNPEYCEIENNMLIASAPEPKTWENDEEKQLNNYVEKFEIYNQDSYLPGKIFDKIIGSTNTEKNIYIQLYPVQYLPKQSKTILITSGEIYIYYKETPDLHFQSSNNYKNLIITHNSLYESAKNLKEFHESQGISTYVVNTSWIDNNYEPADDPPFEGYKNESLRNSDYIKNYNYDLAKKIIKFLNDPTIHSNLEYVTLLGDAEYIPPSYYYYYDWTPTDFFYSSPDYDLIPNYYIGRLPVNNLDHANHVVSKIINWDGSSELFNNITFSAGQPFGSPYFIGELITIDSLNRGFLRGVNVEKQFETSNAFTKENFLNALKSNKGFVYNIAHGNGNLIEFQYESVLPQDYLLYSTDLMSLPASDNTPVVLSIACSDGAYDSELTNSRFNYSIGEALLLSKGGGIAYVGGTRSNLGQPLFFFDKGRLEITKETYMAGLLTYIFQEYSKGGGTLGSITSNARLTYLEKNNMKNNLDLFTYFAFILLGDPALKIPDPPVNNQYSHPFSEPVKPVNYIGIDINGSIPIYAVGETNEIKIQSDSPYLDYQLVQTTLKQNESYIISTSTQININNNFTYFFEINASNFYTIRAITKDGKETWQFFYAYVLVDDDFTSSTPGYGKTKWSKIQDAIDNAEMNQGIYVFNGTYNENIIIDKPLTLIGENETTTMIQSKKNDNIVTIKESSCIIVGFTIQDSGLVKKLTGISVEGNFAIIQNCIIQNNKNGIEVKSGGNPYGFFTQINGNKITKNNIGIYLQNNRIMPSFIIVNTITDNKQGLYLEKTKTNIIAYNTIKNNDEGIYLFKSKLNAIIANDFIENQRHAQFVKSYLNLWGANYWDNWIGLDLEKFSLIPKYIWGRNGLILGLIPSKDTDRTPSYLPYAWDEYLEQL